MLDHLPTPCLLLEASVMERNCARMVAAAERRGVPFRVHLKTAKSREIATLCAQHFGERATVSTLAEIGALQGCGFRDFLYAVAIVPAKFEAVAALCNRDCAVTVTLDSVAVARELVDFSAAADVRIPAVIEIDLDGHRSGVKSSDVETLLAIGRVLGEAGLLRGVMTHAGGSYALDSAPALDQCALDEAAQTAAAARTLREAGFDCDLISVGSTPTALADAAPRVANELRAGVFVFFDLVQCGIGACHVDDIALSVLASVVSVNTDSHSLIVDAGWMALSADRGTAAQRVDMGYGQVCLADGTLLPDIIVADAQQEHGIVQVRAGSRAALPDLKPGDRVRILPNHACATAAQHAQYHVLDAQQRPIACWARTNHW